jgi:hypothetical protein
VVIPAFVLQAVQEAWDFLRDASVDFLDRARVVLAEQDVHLGGDDQASGRGDLLGGDLIQVVNDLELQIRETEYKRKAPFKKGEQVLVTRGRKVPVGTIAHVAYVNNGGLLLKTKENVDVRMSPAIGWVDAVYCERLVLHAHEEDVRCHGE